MPDGRGVVFEADDRVVGVSFQSVLDQTHQALWLGLPINDQVSPKEPVTAACANALRLCNLLSASDL